jgi:hypothetical protein
LNGFVADQSLDFRPSILPQDYLCIVLVLAPYSLHLDMIYFDARSFFHPLNYSSILILAFHSIELA